MFIKECLELRELVAKLVEWESVILRFEAIKPLRRDFIDYLVIDAVYAT